MPAYASQYLDLSAAILRRIGETQLDNIGHAADWCAASILAGRLVHLFGSGHSRIPVEEMFPRYGSFPGFHPIVELSLTFHNQVVGANGQRQAMFLEQVEGLAEVILSNFALDARDTAILFSARGSSAVTVDMALGFRKRGINTIAVTSLANARSARLVHSSGQRLHEACDLTIDICSPAGDAMVRIPGLDTPVSPGSSLGACAVVNALKAEIAHRLTEAGQPPLVLTSSYFVGEERSRELFERVYEDYRRRVGVLYD
ncbi:MAG: SIS domain-containing protein [Acidobacteria bacterium]|nr:SIS domain-containing protein [Acidobacteriota bacterium]